MAAVPIEVSGVLYDLLNRTTQRVVLVGEASIVGLTVGGGPVLPPEQVPPGGGGGGVPIHPIWGPPGFNPPGPGMPPGIGGGPIIPEEPPIPPDTELPDPVPPSAVIKESPPSGGWGLYSRADSSVYWAYDPPNGAAGPKK